MKKKIFRYLKHALLTIVILVSSAILFGLINGAGFHYGDNPLMMNWDGDGPYIFYGNDSVLNVNFIKGNQKDGFYLDTRDYTIGSDITISCNNPFDSTSFDLSIQTDFSIPEVTYNDNNKILAISDIESNYISFRDFLINSQVIDQNLNWTFGKGHLVLVGDFVDRGFFTTQVLWLIYKLEQEAKKYAGNVHFIIGNHELKTMQGNYMSASPKYYHVASILGRQQFELYNSESLLGKWLSSKNALELINGNLFVHGGIHPEVAETGLSLKEINQLLRDNYYKPFFPGTSKDATQLILSSNTGPCWYRGYFKDDLSQEEVENGLAKFNAQAVIVGHTLQSKVKRLYNGKVIAIDVQHPSDDHKNWPKRESEALLIDEGKYYRVFDDGEKEQI